MRWARSRPQCRLETIGLAMVLIAGSALCTLAKPAPKATAQTYQRETSENSYRAADDDRSHCGQRSFSISVGNPAFSGRIAQWPRPCGW